MALEESRRTSVASATPPGRGAGGSALRGTQAISLGDVQERWGKTLERDGTSGPGFDAAIGRILDGDALGDIDEAWLAFLTHQLQVCAVYSQTVHDVLTAAAARCEWGPISRALDVQALLLVRQAQALVLFTMDLERVLGTLPLEEARARWEGAEGWQPTRRLLAKLALREDWGEVLVAVNLCLEPLVGQLFRREWAITIARAHGDAASPLLAEPTQVQSAWVRDWTRATVLGACERPRDGDANRATIEGWLAEWAPRARHAAEALTEMTLDLPVPGCGADALARVVADHEAALSELGLPVRRGGAR